MKAFPRGVVAGVALFLSGCLAASGRQGPTPSDEAFQPAAARWLRQADPFPVLDSNGLPYQLPFLGGFNVPRPQLVDIDADGDQDLFVQEVTDELMYFEGEDGPDGRRYRWRPEMFSEIRIGEWYRFADVDGDGDTDLLTEQPFSHIRLYRNSGSPESPRFELAADTLRDNLGEPIFSDRQNIPNAADLDCDGLLDLLIGRLVGTVTRYEATAGIGANGLSLRHVTDRFEDIEIVGSPEAAPNPNPGPQPLGPLGGGPAPFPGGLPTVRHGANTMVLADIEGDGDLDLFWGDFFEPGLLFIENRGSCAQPNLQSVPVPFPPTDPVRTSGYNAPAFGDLDGDGDLDLLIGVLGGAYNPNTTTADNLFHLSQGETGFELETRRFISQIDAGSESVPILVDLDSDGDLDLFVSNRLDPDDPSTSRVFRFDNVGAANAPEFRSVGELDVDGAYHNVPAFGDLDGDGDLDILLGTWLSELRYLENIGTPEDPEFRLVDPTFVQLTRGSNAAPALGDLDGDTDLDLIVGESDGTLTLFENVGGPTAPLFRLAAERYGDIDVGRRSFPVLIDSDGDDDLDLVIGTEMNGIVYYENQGDASRAGFVRVESPFPGGEELPRLSTPAFGDLDGDGDADLVVGGIGGGVYFFERDPLP